MATYVPGVLRPCQTRSTVGRGLLTLNRFCIADEQRHGSGEEGRPGPFAVDHSDSISTLRLGVNGCGSLYRLRAKGAL